MFLLSSPKPLQERPKEGGYMFQPNNSGFNPTTLVSTQLLWFQPIMHAQDCSGVQNPLTQQKFLSNKKWITGFILIFRGGSHPHAPEVYSSGKTYRNVTYVALGQKHTISELAGLVGKTFLHPVRVFCAHLDHPNAHMGQKQIVGRLDYYISYIPIYPQWSIGTPINGYIGNM